MKGISRFLPFTLGILLIFSSCGGFSDIVVGEVQEVNIRGFEDNALLVDVRLPVENPTLHRITILDIDSKVYLGNQYLGRVTSVERIVLKANSKDIYDLSLRIRLANVFGTAFTLMKLKSGQKALIRVEGTITARTMVLKKKIPFEETREVVI